MAYLIAFVIFALLSAATWFVSVAVYRSTFGEPDPATTSGYRGMALAAVTAVALSGFIPFPWGYFFAVGVWVVAVVGFLDLPPGRSAALVGYLAAGSFLTRLLILGAMELF